MRVDPPKLSEGCTLENLTCPHGAEFPETPTSGGVVPLERPRSIN